VWFVFVVGLVDLFLGGFFERVGGCGFFLVGGLVAQTSRRPSSEPLRPAAAQPLRPSRSRLAQEKRSFNAHPREAWGPIFHSEREKTNCIWRSENQNHAKWTC